MHTQVHMQQLFMSLKTHYNRLSLCLSLDSAGRHIREKIKTFLWVLERQFRNMGWNHGTVRVVNCISPQDWDSLAGEHGISLILYFCGYCLKWNEIQENVKFKQHCCYGHLAGTVQKVCKITEEW